MSAFAMVVQEVMGRVAWTSLQATLLVGALWLLNRQLPRLSAATRSLLWWLLGVQLLLGLALPTPLALPLLSPPRAEAIAATPAPTMVASEHHITVFGSSTARRVDVTEAAPAPAPVPSASQPPWWSRVLPTAFALWLAGVIVQLLVTFRHWREARAVVRSSRPLDDAQLQALCAMQAKAMGLRRCPSLRVSDAIRSPQVSGLWRPVVLLPAHQNLSSDESALALAHELTHLRRGDLWMGWIPGIAQRLFFFHPMVSWAMREYALNREAACDAQVVQHHDAAPQDYGRLLLRLGVAHPLHAGLAGASPTFHNLKRRLTMLQSSDQGTTSRLRSALLVVMVACVGVLPYRVTQAKAEQPAPATAASTWATPATPPTPATPATPMVAPTPATPLTPPTPAASATPAPRVKPHSVPVPPAPPAPPVPQTPKAPAPPAPPAPPSSGFSAHNVDIDTHSGATTGFALIDHDSVVVNGGETDLATAKRLRDEHKPLVMYRRGNQAYVIRDEATVERAKAAFAAVSALSDEEGRLSGEEGRISGEEAGIGAREAALGERLSRIAERESEAMVRLEEHPSADQGAAERATFAAERAQIEREHRELERDQQSLQQKQQALNKQMEALGHRTEQASAQATQQMNRLLDEALAKGIAQPLNNR